MGGRVATETMLNLAEAAGYVGRVVSLSWKEQSEPENVIGGYAEFEKNGLGPVSFSQPAFELERALVDVRNSFTFTRLRLWRKYSRITSPLQPLCAGSRLRSSCGLIVWMPQLRCRGIVEERRLDIL